MLSLESFGPDPFSVGTFCIGSVVSGGNELAPCFFGPRAIFISGVGGNNVGTGGG